MANGDRLFDNPRGPVNELRATKPMTGIVSEQPYNKLSERVAEYHHESENERRDNDRITYAQNPAINIPEVSPLKIDKPQKYDPFDPNNYGHEVKIEGESYLERFQQSQAKQGIVVTVCNKLGEFYQNHQKIVIAATFAGMVVAGFGYNAFISESQTAGFESHKDDISSIPPEIEQTFETIRDREEYLQSVAIDKAMNGETLTANDINSLDTPQQENAKGRSM